MEVKLTFNQPGYPVPLLKVLMDKKGYSRLDTIQSAKHFIDLCRDGKQDQVFYLTDEFSAFVDKLIALGFEVTEVPDIWADPFKIHREQDALAKTTLDEGLSSNDIEVVKLQLRALHNLYANKLVSGGFA